MVTAALAGPLVIVGSTLTRIGVAVVMETPKMETSTMV